MKQYTRRILPALLLLLLPLSSAAQAPFNQPTAMVGVPYSFDVAQAIFGQELGTIVGSFPGYSVNLTCTTTGNVPPGLSVTADCIVNGTPTQAGTFTFTVSLVFSITADGVSESFPLPIPLTVMVQPGTGPQVSLQPGGLTFNLTTGSAAAQQNLTFANRGATPVAIMATASAANWLSVSGSGTVAAFGQSVIQVTANPTGLAAGTYTGSVSVSGAFPGSPLKAVVVLTVTSAQPLLRLTQSGLFFRTSAGAQAPPSQSFLVINAGVGSLNWSATATTQTGSGWLSITPASGTSSASNAPAVTVSVNPTGLAAGTYYGQVQVSAQGVANSPQAVEVVLNVLAPSPTADPDVRPTGLIFVGTQGTSGPAPQALLINNIASAAASYATAISYGQGTGWLTVSPTSGSVPAGAQTSLTVVASPAKLTPGVYSAQLSVVFTQSNTTHRISVVFIVLPGASSVARAAADCGATKLLPVFTTLGQNFVNSAAWPSTIELRVVDDCGTPVTTGSVVVSFSSGDSPISLASLNDGRWSGTWTPHNLTSSPISITASAQTLNPVLSGTAMIGGTSQANPTVPQVSSGGVVNAASNAGSIPLAPGSMISIYGAGLGQGLALAQSLPLPVTLNGTQVLLKGRPLPLLFTSDNQINAVVPYDLATNTSQQVVVSRNNAFSVPESVSFADAGPAVFTTDGKTAIVVGVRADQSQYLVDANHPAAAGDALVIYATGLGAVDQNIAPGAVSPGSPLANAVNPVTVTIEGQSAQVFFAGLAPGFTSLYQVNAFVPSGLTTSPAAPLVLQVNGQTSPVATIAVK